jgi:CRP-like cAMP-binding protein
MDDTRLALLAGAPFARGLSDDELRLVAGLATRRALRPRQVLFREGEEAAALYLVLAGRIKLAQSDVEGREVIVRLVGPGGLLAAVSAFADTTYPANAEALEPSTILVWPRQALPEMFRQVPALGLNAMQILSERIREMQERFRELATERVTQRVARTLLRLVRQAGRRTEEGVLIDLPLSRRDLAELTGTTLFTVSRILSAWEAAGTVRTGRRRVVIRSPHALVAIAEDLPPVEPPGPSPGSA